MGLPPSASGRLNVTLTVRLWGRVTEPQRGAPGVETLGRMVKRGVEKVMSSTLSRTPPVTRVTVKSMGAALPLRLTTNEPVVRLSGSGTEYSLSSRASGTTTSKKPVAGSPGAFRWGLAISTTIALVAAS